MRSVLALLSLGVFIATDVAYANPELNCPSGNTQVAYRTGVGYGSLGDAIACINEIPNTLETALPTAQINAQVSACLEIKPNSGRHIVILSTTHTLVSSVEGKTVVNVSVRRDSDGAHLIAGSVETRQRCTAAPPPPSCDIESRERFQAVFPDDQHPEQLCDGSNTCEMKIEQRLSGFGTSLGGGSTGFSIYQYRNTGAACTTGTPSVSELEEAAAINQPNAGIHEVDTDAAPQQTDQDATKQCGYINGEKHCFQRNNLPSGGCITTQNGNAICTTSAPELPRDAQGNPVPPDVVITNNQADGSGTQGGGTGAGDTRNYYTQTTITNNLAAGGTGLGEGGGDGEGEGDGDGDCDPETEECDGEGEGEGEGDCDPLAEECGLGGGQAASRTLSSKTIAESIADFRTRASESDVIGSVADLALSLPSSGICPTASFPALGDTFTINAHCQLLDVHGPLIRAMFLVLYGIVAVFVFLKA